MYFAMASILMALGSDTKGRLSAYTRPPSIAIDSAASANGYEELVLS